MRWVVSAMVALLATTAFLTGVLVGTPLSGGTAVRAAEPQGSGARPAMRITVSTGGIALVYELNGSRASRDLYAQLPLTVAVEDYGGKEKIFYPPEKLGTADTPLAGKVEAGVLAYYAPWGDVVLFYESFRPARGLYDLGRLVSGTGDIRDLSGTVRVDKATGG